MGTSVRAWGWVRGKQADSWVCSTAPFPGGGSRALTRCRRRVTAGQRQDCFARRAHRCRGDASTWPGPDSGPRRYANQAPRLKGRDTAATVLDDGPGWLVVATELAAIRLLGCELERELDSGETLRVRIVETEAYDQDDEASHAFGGLTARNASMFGRAGHLYVYTMYGHHCCNIVTGRTGYGQGALIRAVEPLEGEAAMQQRRGGRQGVQLTNGPGKLCQALDITLALNGHPLAQPPLRLVRRPALHADRVASSTRVGITKAASAPRRFLVRDSPYLSKGP